MAEQPSRASRPAPDPSTAACPASTLFPHEQAGDEGPVVTGGDLQNMTASEQAQVASNMKTLLTFAREHWAPPPPAAQPRPAKVQTTLPADMLQARPAALRRALGVATDSQQLIGDAAAVVAPAVLQRQRGMRPQSLPPLHAFEAHSMAAPDHSRPPQPTGHLSIRSHSCEPTGTAVSYTHLTLPTTPYV